MSVDWQRLPVLIADDHRFILSVLFQLLKDIGLKSDNIYQAPGSAEAVQILKTVPIGLVICDINMGPMNGFQLTKEIRTGRMGLRRDLPIIFLTAYADPVTVKAAADLDASAFIVKPVAKKDLLARMEHALDAPKPVANPATYDAANIAMSPAVRERTAAAAPAPPTSPGVVLKAKPAPTPGSAAAAAGGVRMLIKDLMEGDRLAADVVTPNGMIAVKAGTTLSRSAITRLASLMSLHRINAVLVEPR
ncbi:MAG: response regulator, partial [Alphaproteobacteria bacterium]|nr:response regulator [Alphaproteobacteria bacterium]